MYFNVMQFNWVKNVSHDHVRTVYDRIKAGLKYTQGLKYTPGTARGLS